MDLERVLARLVQHSAALGAVLCDEEGESIVHALGPAPLVPAARKAAASLLPRDVDTGVDPAELAIRVVGAEVCALLRLFDEAGQPRGTGRLSVLSFGYEGLSLHIGRLPEDYYVVVVTRAPDPERALARRRLIQVSRTLCELLDLEAPAELLVRPSGPFQAVLSVDSI